MGRGFIPKPANFHAWCGMRTPTAAPAEQDRAEQDEAEQDRIDFFPDNLPAIFVGSL
jgi:hypothetical protein